MIDLGLSKIALIGAVALVVVGPQRLPMVARMAGSLFGRAQRYINEIKAEVSREVELEELRKMQKDMQQAAGEVAQSLSDIGHSVNAAWSSDVYHPPRPPLAPDRLADKAKDFRKKKLVRASALPAWYKRQRMRKARALSAVARSTRARPARRP